MAVLAADVLREWREAERLLELLPAESPDRLRVARALEEMQTLYQRVTETVPTTDTTLRASFGRIDATRALLRETRARLDGSP
jgi:hypothetical protein